MHRNGQPQLHVLLSGAPSGELSATLASDTSLSVVRPIPGDDALAQVDVALHVISESSDLQAEVAKLRSMSQAPMVLAAYGEPNGIVEQGLQFGAADVMVLPQSTETVLFALRKAAIAPAAAAAADQPTGRVVTVFSPKGGTGKTVLSTNIAVAAQRMGTPTILVDLDLQFGDAALALSVPPRATIADLAGSSGAIDIEKLNAFVGTDARSSLTLLAAPKRPEEAQLVGQAELGAALDAARRAYKAVVVDTGPLFDAPMLAALDRSDRLLVVCNPEVTSLKNARIGLETIERLGFPRERIDLVANRIGAAGGVSRDEIEEALECEIAFELPDDPAVPEAINRATPVVLVEPGSRFSRAVTSMANDLFAGASAPADKKAPAPRRALLRGRR
jgi:pilus assembly protein CpaE